MSDRVGGTVTFMFTDIEGSTSLLKTLGRDRYGELLADHQRLLREVFAAHRGDEIETQGDAFFVAFRSASDALAAATAIQRALAAHAWPDEKDVRVRIGVHSGEAAATGERYLGISVHRAARVGAAGHGGQVLLSSSTRELVEDDLPEGLSLRDLGAYQLKDIDRPERLSQLVIEGLPSEFPALKASAVVDHRDRRAEPDERHYWLVSGLISDGLVVPFLGAGANLCDRPPRRAGSRGATCRAAASSRSTLAERSTLPGSGDVDLLRISQYVDAMLGAGQALPVPALRLRRRLSAEQPPSAPRLACPPLLRERGLAQQLDHHDELRRPARAGARGGRRAVRRRLVRGEARARSRVASCTGAPTGEIVPIERPNKYTALVARRAPVVLKLHGAIDRADPKRDSYVDHRGQLHRLPRAAATSASRSRSRSASGWPTATSSSSATRCATGTCA